MDIKPGMIYKKDNRYCLITEVNLGKYPYAKLANGISLDLGDLKKEGKYIVGEYNIEKFNDVIYR